MTKKNIRVGFGEKQCAICLENKKTDILLENDDGSYVCEDCAASYCEY